jgi:hypothetical protein
MLTADLNRNRRMGAEFEATMPLIGGGGAAELRQTFARILTENGVPAVARHYSHTPVPDGFDVAVEHDGSISGETQYRGIEWVAVEVKTRILNGVEDYDRVVEKLLAVCRYLGARVNASTGHHLHVEFKEVVDDPEHLRSFYNVAHRFDHVVFGLVSPSRRASTFCRPLPNRPSLLHECRTLGDYQRLLEAAGLERYWALNMTHLFGEGPRIEFRHHQGTLDFDKARHWRNLCLRLIDHSIQRTCKATKAQLPNDRESIGRMLVTLGFKPNTRVFAKVSPELRASGRFLLKRWCQFNQPCRASRSSTTPPSCIDPLPDFSTL